MELSFDVASALGGFGAIIAAGVGFWKYRKDVKEEAQQQIQQVIITWVKTEAPEAWYVRVSNYSSMAILNLHVITNVNGSEKEYRFPCVHPGDYVFETVREKPYSPLIPVKDIEGRLDTIKSKQHAFKAYCLDVNRVK